MKTDMNLTQLAQEIQRRQQSKRDYVARQDALRFAVSCCGERDNGDAVFGARLAVGSSAQDSTRTSSRARSAAANEHDDYEAASALEDLGGRIITLDRDQWRELSEAA